jgi:hypothetical protein
MVINVDTAGRHVATAVVVVVMWGISLKALMLLEYCPAKVLVVGLITLVVGTIGVVFCGTKTNVHKDEGDEEDPKTYFVSGHGDLTDEEFKAYYKPKLDAALQEGARFVVGDFRGCDDMTQKYLWDELEYEEDTDRVMVFHMMYNPRHNAGFRTFGNFQSDEERDMAMTLLSDEDIAWVRPGREDSGTGNNLDRRIRFSKGLVQN